MTGQERMTRWWGATWGYWTLDGPKTSRASRHSFHGSSGPTSHSSFRHGKMPHLPKHSSLAHITEAAVLKERKARVFPAEPLGQCQQAALPSSELVDVLGPPATIPFPLPLLPFPCWKKSHSLGFWGCFFPFSLIALYFSLPVSTVTDCVVSAAPPCPRPATFICLSPDC